VVILTYVKHMKWKRYRTNYFNPYENGDSLLFTFIPLKLSVLNVLVFVGCIL